MDYEEFSNLIETVASRSRNTNQEWFNNTGLPDEAENLLMETSRTLMFLHLITTRNLDTALRFTSMDMFAMGWDLALATMGYTAVGPLDKGAENER